MRTRIYAKAAAALACAAAIILPATWTAAASAAATPSPRCPVTITDSPRGVLTTGSSVHTGEVIQVIELLPSGWYGPVAYRLTVVKDAVPDVIKVSPSFPRSYRGSEVFGSCSPGGLNLALGGRTTAPV